MKSTALASLFLGSLLSCSAPHHICEERFNRITIIPEVIEEITTTGTHIVQAQAGHENKDFMLLIPQTQLYRNVPTYSCPAPSESTNHHIIKQNVVYYDINGDTTFNTGDLVDITIHWNDKPNDTKWDDKTHRETTTLMKTDAQFIKVDGELAPDQYKQAQIGAANYDTWK
jgi:hypothetical protein